MKKTAFEQGDPVVEIGLGANNFANLDVVAGVYANGHFTLCTRSRAGAFKQDGSSARIDGGGSRVVHLNSDDGQRELKRQRIRADLHLISQHQCGRLRKANTDAWSPVDVDTLRTLRVTLGGLQSKIEEASKSE